MLWVWSSTLSPLKCDVEKSTYRCYEKKILYRTCANCGIKVTANVSNVYLSTQPSSQALLQASIMTLSRCILTSQAFHNAARSWIILSDDFTDSAVRSAITSNLAELSAAVWRHLQPHRHYLIQGSSTIYCLRSLRLQGLRPWCRHELCFA